ncbi:MAG: hypothetical protein JJ863_09365 [Deltaproteobacteria bacterium]|nr:hypothetical protein [Deltaproteobacteria bacterium]
MMHPATELFVRTDGVGVGVRATEALPLGTLLWVRDALDLVLEPNAIRRLAPALRAPVRRLGYRNARGQWIVCWDAGKHVNHSCDPTMRGVGHDAMVAVRAVRVGDEITCDYAECNLDETLSCLCGAPSCRGSIGGPIAEATWKRWQQEVEAAVARADHLPQPLLKVCEDPRVAQVFAGGRPVPTLSDVAISPRESDS